MDPERIVQRLRGYRLRNDRFDRLMGAVMSNETAARAVRAAASAAAAVSRRRAGVRAPEGLRLPGSPEPLRAPEGVFFIVGQARSGTTWVRTALGQHPGILCRGEGRFFERDFLREDFERWEISDVTPVSLYGALAGSKYLRAWLERSVWASGRDPEEHLENLTRLAVDYFLSQNLGEARKIVGDKTPFVHPQFVEEIARMYPEARVIHIIRDGRDMAVSRMHHMWSFPMSEGGVYDLDPEELDKRDRYRAGTLGDESIFTEARLSRLAGDWSAGVGKVVSDGPRLLGDHYVEVRYEELLREPVENLRRLLQFLGADAGMADSCVEKASFERGAKRKQGLEDSSSRYRKGVAGDWKNAFTEADRETFKKAGGGLLIQLGYEADDAW